MMVSLFNKTRPNNKRNHDYVHSESVFHSIVTRELARSDRHGNSFALMTLSLNGNGNDENIFRLIETLKKRIRSIDELGWLKKNTMGLVLPGTKYEGAAELSADINEILSPENGFYETAIYIYPQSDPPFRWEKTDSSEKTAADQPNGLFKYIGRPLPFWKRVLDIIGAAIALILFLPFFIATAVYIKLVSTGPVFFKQERIGYLGIPFTCLKFRTMRVDVNLEKHKHHVCHLIRHSKTLVKIDHEPDSCVIPFGNLLRSLGIDELPQLINVLKGEMSLIGPRPCMDYEAAELCNWHCRRFDIHPGLTGLWQVSGKNRTTFEEMMRLDIKYGQKRTLFLDVGIFFRTFPLLYQQATELLAMKRRRSRS